MKIKFLGTGAYEGVPGLFCRCRVCLESMKLGGRNLRSRSQALVNDDLMIDFCPDTVWHTQRYSLDWSKITACLITHSHSDHLYPKDIAMIARGYSHEQSRICFHAGKKGYKAIRKKVKKEAVAPFAAVHLVKNFQKFSVGKDGKYEVFSMPANHSRFTSPMIYAIRSNGKQILYAHDSGYYSEKTWARLAQLGRFDLISLDCTGGLAYNYRDNHMCVEPMKEAIQRMENLGLIDSRTVRVANHFSHNGGNTYDELSQILEKDEIVVSYDGMEIEI